MEIIIATAALVIFGYFNMKESGLSGRMQFIFCTIMVVSIVAIIFMIGAHPGTGLANLQPLFITEMTTFAAIIYMVARRILPPV